MTNERTPPHNANAERAIIGAVLAYGNPALGQASSLMGDDFFAPAHRHAWAAIVETAKAGAFPDPIAVEVEIKKATAQGIFDGGWMAWAIAAMSDACAGEQVGHYARIVSEASRARQLISVCVDTIARAYGDADWQDLINTHRQSVANLEAMGSDSATVHVSVPLGEYCDELETLKDGGTVETISTGLANLDAITGGYHPAQLIVVAARPGQGKTAYACNTLATNAIRGVPCLMFSLEMIARELAERWLIWDTRLTKNQVRSADMMAWKKILNTKQVFTDSALYVNDKATGLSAIVGEARRWHAKRVRGRKSLSGKVDARALIAVDYAQLVRVRANKNQNREQIVAAISGTMKQLAKELECPVMLIAQLNRECEKQNRPPIISDLRESGALEQDADMIIFPHSPKPEDPKKFAEPRAAQLIVAKNRGGAIGIAEEQWVPELMTFRQLTNDGYYEPGENR